MLRATTWFVLAVFIVLLHLFVSFLAPNSYGLHVFGDGLQAALLLCCYVFTLPNQVGRNRASGFWTLVSVGFALWLLNQALWTFFEVVLQKAPTPGFWGDIVLFLHPIPMIMAVVAGARFGRKTILSAVSVMVLWLYLYIVFVGAWQYVVFDNEVYGRNFNVVYGGANLSLALLAALRSCFTRGRWRGVFLHLLGASSVYALASYLASSAIDNGGYYTGSVYDVPLVCSLLWFAATPLVGINIAPGDACAPMDNHWERWPVCGALAAVICAGAALSLTSKAPPQIAVLRIVATVAAGIILSLLLIALLTLDGKSLHVRSPKLSQS